VGFRPAVHRIATALNLTGSVRNDTRGVAIELQGRLDRIDEFLRRLRGRERPPMARIETIESVEIPAVDGESGFLIARSDASGTALSQVTPDIATCADCLREMLDPADFRYRYPFINCTNCGPRYSIVRTIPYDRPNTTMAPFEMCDRCRLQYEDVADRRFHAQPVACPRCGPRIHLVDPTGRVLAAGTEPAITQAARMLHEGRILAIKGIGGFHLAVDAANETAVKRLRQRKGRDHKPFALMASSIERISRYAVVDPTAEAVLTDPRAPIVLLDRRPDAPIAPSVAEGVATYGFMLCYAPLHHLLFAEGPEVLVMTSGNISDEPLICDNDKALERLGGVADAFIIHDRRIYRQVDDSIVHQVAGEPVPLRRARGYVPAPILTSAGTETDIFAAGSDLKNTFCLVKGNQLICSEHIGDLADAEVYRHYAESIEHLKGLFEVEPRLAVCDLHPGYLSTQYTQSLAGIEVMQVQHHWAHVASVLAEHHLDGPVIGLVCDGTGYGTDGAIWGCECLVASLDSFERFAHLAYYDLPGGDRAAKQAIRPLLSLLKQAYGDEFDPTMLSVLLERIEPDADARDVIAQQLDKRVHTVATSSLGRVFDAAAALLGLGNFNHFDAQLPMAIEAAAADGIEESYEFSLISSGEGKPMTLDLRRMLVAMIADILGGVTPASVIAARFHNTIAEAMLETARAAARRTGIEIVALSGGVFCNRYLIERLIRRLNETGLRVLWNRDVPANDGGLSLGQAAIAAAAAGKARFAQRVKDDPRNG